MDQTCVVVVTLRPKPGCVDEVVSVINREIEEIRSSPGAQAYELYRGVDERVVLIEKWGSRGEWQAHFETPAIERLKRDLTPLLSEPAERAEMYPA